VRLGLDIRDEVVTEEVPENIVTEGGTAFVLRDGWTLEKLTQGEVNPMPLLCRVRHNREVVGDPWHQKDDLFQYAFNTIRGARALTRCRRCRRLAIRTWPT
jgi:hypothetical protein